MADAMIANLIREVLAEELARVRAEGGQASGSGARIESVRITNDAELRTFAERVLTLGENPETRRAIKEGALVFRLEGSSATPSPAVAGGNAGPAGRFERGLLSERDVDRLPTGTKSIQIGKAVRMTPLARDRLRHRGITIERTD